MLADFHVHSIYSDGELIPSEIFRRYSVRGYDAVAVTEHIDFSNYEEIEKIKESTENFNGIETFVGAEITHVPVNRIEEIIGRAKDHGAEVIIVHGESPVEPVEAGTNSRALELSDVDILAHPGFVTEEEAYKAKENDIYLEISARSGHCYCNGHVAKVSKETGASVLVNSDAHGPRDLLDEEMEMKIARGAGFSENKAKEIVNENTERFMKRLKR
ncbi:MAG: Histidinol phosphatase HIS2, PHP superfamily [Candidatus Methanohalarchaeum thermophilum]|uniref:Histidinol phosphatase HIS2, PHP superfamily n=1 Tax=Methanohalarchaeum thermophilum TaxID=1903181 RepID=A0A1Q6DXX8_METT1|nr:MAG: Histidinol phosphatase HIS2, PHP superfamily [Candidatus Methanohalarchaeum thermophilum]